MRDKIRLVMYEYSRFSREGGKAAPALDVTDSFISYTIDSDLYQAADAFDVELADPRLGVEPGMMVRLYVNGTVELIGMIDKVTASGTKEKRTLSISGRDLMGLVADHYCEDFGEKTSLDGSTLRRATELLIKKVPIINRKDIVYEAGVDKYDVAAGSGKVGPGDKVGEILARMAAARDLLFWCNPAGTFIFGRPKSKGTAGYNLIRKKVDSSGNNILEGSLIRDIAGAYSQVSVAGQITQYDSVLVDGKTISYPVIKNCFETAAMPAGILPAGFYKPMRVEYNAEHKIAPGAMARKIIQEQRAKAFLLEYNVPFHSQSGRNFTANELATIDDDEILVNGHPLHGVYLIYARTFVLNKQDGPTTKLRLGLPGVILNG